MDWWHRYFQLGACPAALLVRPPTSVHIPVTDASGVGYGGMFFGNDGVIYYFYGTWNDEIQDLFRHGILDINILELATIELLLHAAGVSIQSQSFVLKCDNDSSVSLLTSYKARRYTSGKVLANIDLLLAQHDLDIKFEHIPGVENRLADWLSRIRLDLFTQQVRRDHPTARLVEIRLPKARTDISHVVRASSWSRG